MSSCPIWAEDVNSSGQMSGQPGPSGAGSAGLAAIDPRAVIFRCLCRRRPFDGVSAHVVSAHGISAEFISATIVSACSLSACIVTARIDRAAVTDLSGPANAACVPPDIAMPALGNRLIESTWYTRVDYFNWNEHSTGSDDVNEYGTLLTFGYMRRVGIDASMRLFLGRPCGT